MSAGSNEEVRDSAGRDDTTERFEQLARRTGAEFRRPATSAELAAIGDLARVRRRQQQVGVAAVVAVAVVGGLWLLPGGRSSTPSTPSSPTSTAAPDTTAPATTIPLSVAVDGEIAFQRFVEGQVDIHRLLPDGTDGGVLLELLPATGSRGHLDWSPSGDQVVVTVGSAGGTDELWVAAPDGSAATKVVACAAPCIAVDEAAWSPDGGTIAFWRQVGPESSITSTLELLDVGSGTTSVVLTAEPDSVVLAPRWSPDGTRLVVERLLLDGPRIDANPVGDVIGVVDLRDAVPSIQPLTAAERFAGNPDWSPDGSSLVFAARVPGASTRQDLYLMTSDGTGERRLTTTADDGDMAVQPTFTPDGSAVVFSFHPGGASRGVVRVVPVAGGAPFAPGSGKDVAGDVPRMRPSG